MPAVIGDLSALKTGRRKLARQGLAEREGFELMVRLANASEKRSFF
jgi:hypothetical protein